MSFYRASHASWHCFSRFTSLVYHTTHPLECFLDLFSDVQPTSSTSPPFSWNVRDNQKILHLPLDCVYH